MSEQEIAKKVPAHAVRLLTPQEGVRCLTRPRLLPLSMLVFMVVVVLGVAVFSTVIEDPGFMRLLTIPAIPVMGGFVGYLILAPVILVTDYRIISAHRFCRPLSLDLEKLKTFRVRQNRLGRLLGYSTLVLLFHPPRDLGKGVFLQFELKKLPDAALLGSAISAAAAALRNRHERAASCIPVKAPNRLIQWVAFSFW